MSAFSLESEEVSASLLGYIKAWGPVSEAQMNALRDLSCNPPSDTGDNASTSGSSILSSLLHPTMKSVVVRAHVSGSRRILAHSLTVEQFAVAQFYHPRITAEYHAIIVRFVAGLRPVLLGRCIEERHVLITRSALAALFAVKMEKTLWQRRQTNTSTTRIKR